MTRAMSHALRCAVCAAVAVGAAVLAFGAAAPSADAKPVRGPATRVVTQAALNELKVMNYYPAAAGWSKMWTDASPEVVDQDFARLAALHANTVRIIINMPAFGFPTPSAQMLSELRQAVELAAKNGLRVQLTLFDWWSQYADVSGSKAWATAVLAPYKDDPRVAFVELQNEIVPENATAMSWARALVPHLRAAVGAIPVTVSVTAGASGGPAAELSRLITALGAAAQPDFYDVHQYYGAPQLTFAQLRAAAQVATANGRGLFVGEVGASTNAATYAQSGLPQSAASYEAYQDYVYRATFRAASRLGLPVPAPWILWDFVPGSLSWVPPDSDQYNYGLLRVDGTAKPAAASVSAAFAGTATDTSFNNGFEGWSGSPARPHLWSVYHPELGSFATDTTVARSGSASARISASSSSAQGNPSYWATPVEGIQPGTAYTASAYVRGLNASGTTQVCLSWFGGDNGYLGNRCGGSLAGTTSWRQISVAATAPAGAAYVALFLTSAGNAGTAWFDDVAFG